MTRLSLARAAGPLILLFLAVLLQACTTLPTSPKDSQTLRETIAALNIEDPLSDLTRNVDAGDTRFIGIAVYACTAPGVEEGDVHLVRAHGMNCLAGTSDAIESRAHLEMIEKATEYARHCNRALVMRLGEMTAA